MKKSLSVIICIMMILTALLTVSINAEEATATEEIGVAAAPEESSEELVIAAPEESTEELDIATPEESSVEPDIATPEETTSEELDIATEAAPVETEEVTGTWSNLGTKGYIGIAVAVVLLAAVIIAIVVLIPKKNSKKK